MNINQLDVPGPTFISEDFDDHESVIRIENRKIGVKGFIAIHRQNGKNPSLGATRLWGYRTEDEALSDALKLSRLMSYKLAFAGFPYGGAKAVLMQGPNSMATRKEIFSWYADQVNSFNGAFVTGSDVGVGPEDLAVLHENTRYVIGHDVPAGYYTAAGVFSSIKVALGLLYGSGDIHGRTFAVQGLGKTGYELVRFLYEAGGTVTIADLSPDVMARAKKEFPGIIIGDSATIHSLPVDFFCSCALGGAINQESIAALRCRAVVGSANAQLATVGMAQMLHERGILYAVDYVANSGGVISVIDQYRHGTHDDARIEAKLQEVQEKLSGVFLESKRGNVSPLVVADQMAEEHMALMRVS